jgi:hypothetical protein
MTIKQLIRMAGDQPLLKHESKSYRQWIEKQLYLRWTGASPCWQVKGYPAEAQVIRSDWVAKCPDCPEQIIVQAGEPFYCLHCQNARNDGYARPVRWPADREAGEAVLLRRFDPNNRNWNPAMESVEDLKLENEAHSGGLLP